MHELSLIQALFDEVERVVAPHEGATIRAIHVRVGELAGVETELFRSAYDVCRVAGPLAAAELSLTVEPAVWRCSSCESEIARGSVLACDRCGGTPHLAQGGDIFLDRVEAEVQHV